MERRTFIKQMAMAGVMAGLPGGIAARPFVQKVTANKREEMIWANLIHLSFNMWLDNSHTMYASKIFSLRIISNRIRGHWNIIRF